MLHGILAASASMWLVHPEEGAILDAMKGRSRRSVLFATLFGVPRPFVIEGAGRDKRPCRFDSVEPSAAS